jgi:hypothetical protein
VSRIKMQAAREAVIAGRIGALLVTRMYDQRLVKVRLRIKIQFYLQPTNPIPFISPRERSLMGAASYTAAQFINETICV